MVKNIKNRGSVPFVWFEWLIAWRYLKARRKEGGISVIAWYALLGVTLGVGTLIVVQAVMIGFREEFTDKIVGANAHMTLFSKEYDVILGKSKPIINYSELINKLEAVDDVIDAAAVVKGQVMASSGTNNVGVEIIGIELDDLLTIPLIKKPLLSEGNIFDFSEGVAIGNGVARSLDLKIGNSIRLISPNGVSTAFGTSPRVSNFTVQYIFGVGRYDIDHSRIYMPLSKSQEYFNKESGADQIDLILTNPLAVDELKDAIINASENKFLLWTWKNASAAFLNALNVERRVMLIILSLVILIAALNIISGLVMLVKNKTRDIAILRTIGISQGSIMRIFFICGSSIGVMGTIFGVLWGCMFAYYIQEIQTAVEFIVGGSVWNSEIRFLTEVPSRLRFQDIAIAVGISLGISFSITIIPARNAARINPAEAIRDA